MSLQPFGLSSQYDDFMPKKFQNGRLEVRSDSEHPYYCVQPQGADTTGRHKTEEIQEIA
jgi:hypothetical protein